MNYLLWLGGHAAMSIKLLHHYMLCKLSVLQAIVPKLQNQISILNYLESCHYHC